MKVYRNEKKQMFAGSDHKIVTKQKSNLLILIIDYFDLKSAGGLV